MAINTIMIGVTGLGILVKLYHIRAKQRAKLEFEDGKPKKAYEIDKMFLRDSLKFLLFFGYPAYIATLILASKPVSLIPGIDDIFFILLIVLARSGIHLACVNLFHFVFYTIKLEPSDKDLHDRPWIESEVFDDLVTILSMNLGFKSVLFSYDINYDKVSIQKGEIFHQTSSEEFKMLLPAVISNMIFYAHVCYNMTYLFKKYIRKIRNSRFLAEQKSDETDPFHLLNQTCNVLEKSDGTVYSDDSLSVHPGSNHCKLVHKSGLTNQPHKIEGTSSEIQ